MATNAYSGALLGALRRTVVAVPSFQVATVPLPPALRGAILPGGQAASDTWHLLRYFRLDAAAGWCSERAAPSAAVPTPRTVRHHYRAVREIYPQLAASPSNITGAVWSP